MALSDADYLEQLKLARDALVANLIEDSEAIITLTIRGRTKTVADPAAELQRLQDLINVLERKANPSHNRVVSLRRAGYRCCK